MDVFAQSAEILRKFLRIVTSSSTIFRVCSAYGEAVEAPLSASEDSREVGSQEVVYAELDGSMIYTDNAWREVKLGRVFRSGDIRESPTADRAGEILRSEYTAHLGGYEEFVRKFQRTTDRYRDLEERLVFITDGAIWMHHWMNAEYPKATQILDFYHAVEQLSTFAEAALPEVDQRRTWMAQQKAYLLAGGVDTVIKNIGRCAKRTNRGNLEAKRVKNYYSENRDRMQYHDYIRRGLSIGSGAIESAHRTVIQRRMKLSGQRWSNGGVDTMLNLRVCSMSGKWDLIVDLIRQPKTQLSTATL
mgnify:CR=1 FL=1